MHLYPQKNKWLKKAKFAKENVGVMTQNNVKKPFHPISPKRILKGNVQN